MPPQWQIEIVDVKTDESQQQQLQLPATPVNTYFFIL